MPSIIHKRSSVAGKAPQTTDLKLGEVAINTTDGKLYIKKSVNGVESVVSPASIGMIYLKGTLNLYVGQSTALTIVNYDSATSYSVSATGGTATISGSTITYNAGSTAGAFSLSVTATNSEGTSTRKIDLTVNAAGVLKPTNITPANSAVNQEGPTLTLFASAFQAAGLSDNTHVSSDWQVSTNSTFTNIVSSVSESTTSTTGWQATNLSPNTTYYWRVRYRGVAGYVSEWSSATSFTTKAQFSGFIGTQGGQGFGVGIYPGTLPAGFSAMSGTTDLTSDNYGNYQYSDGSVMVFIPKFYYRIGNPASPRYATYGANAIDIVGNGAFANEAAANAAGYALHRAFIDGGSEKLGFFIDKYLASKNGTTSCLSIKYGVPISLYTYTSDAYSGSMSGCSGELADAVVLARARGPGVFNVASVFMYSALALLSLAHGQFNHSSTTWCAWYDETRSTNFPKGCNYLLNDINDTSVTFLQAAAGTNKPLTGSASNLARTTHNGQMSGVADINGALGQVMLGVTSPGATATSAEEMGHGNAYVLKRSIALSSLTGGWGGVNDAWGNAAALSTKYDLVTELFPWAATNTAYRFGNGSLNVFSGATSGTSYLRTACGIQDTNSGVSSAGSNLFGNDMCYTSNPANMFPMGTGTYNDGVDAGIFNRRWLRKRTDNLQGCGFRAAAYGA